MYYDFNSHLSEGQVIINQILLQAYNVLVSNKVTDQLFYLLDNAVFTLIWKMLILDPCISHI